MKVTVEDVVDIGTDIVPVAVAFAELCVVIFISLEVWGVSLTSLAVELLALLESAATTPVQ